jgi:hypothetical protein
MEGGDNKILFLLWSKDAQYDTPYIYITSSTALYIQWLDIINTNKFLNINCSTSGLLIAVKLCPLSSTTPGAHHSQAPGHAGN